MVIKLSEYEYKNFDWYDLLAFFLAATFFLYFIPGAEYFISDADGGYFMEGALHVLRAGEIPQGDFYSSYGPLNFYPRALFFKIIGISLIAEVVYVTLGYAVTYALMFWLARRVSNSLKIAYGLFALALIAHPRYYKFFILLIPILNAISAFAYVNKKSLVTVVLMGSAVGFSFLLRHDFGAYMVTAHVVLIGLSKELPITTRGKHLVILGAVSLCWLLPWFVYLVAYGKLTGYFVDIFQVTFNQSVGMSLPHPLLHWNGKLSILYACFHSLPLVMLLAFGSRWTALETNVRAFYCAITLIMLLALIQSAFRSDFPHLLQSVGFIFVAIAVFWSLYDAPRARSIWRGLLLLPSLIATYILVLDYHQVPLRPLIKVGDIIRTVDVASINFGEDNLPVAHNLAGHIKMIGLLRNCTTSDERVVVYPFAPQIAFFANRLMGSETLALAPGFYDTDSNQHRAIEALKRDQTRIVMWDESKAFDGLPERNPIFTHSILHDYVKKNFDSKIVYEGWVVYRRRDANPIFAGNPACASLNM
jgi:hypothetical protein